MPKLKKKVRNKKTKKIHEFLCMSSEYEGYFIYRLIDGEEICEMGHVSSFYPIGFKWEDIKNES